MALQWDRIANLRGPAGPAGKDASVTLVYGSEKTAGPTNTDHGTPVFGAPARHGSSLTGGVLRAGAVCPEPEGWALTVEAWVLSGTVSTDGSVKVAFSLGNDLWVAADTSGRAFITLSKTPDSRVFSTVNICDGAWHHVAVTVTRRNGVTQLVRFFVDGVEVIGSAPTTAQAWNTNLYVRGITVASYDWQGAVDSIRASIGEIYTKNFTPSASELPVTPRTLVRGTFEDQNIMDVAVRSYGTRPSAETTPAGSVTYVGPMRPSDWLTDDRWVKNG